MRPGVIQADFLFLHGILQIIIRMTAGAEGNQILKIAAAGIMVPVG